MKMNSHLVQIFTVILLPLASWAVDTSFLYCSVCKAIVKEIRYEIRQVDPKKKIQIGSFRVDPDGKQARYEVPYARSSVHLHDIIDDVCKQMEHYGISAGAEEMKIVRVKNRDGSKVNDPTAASGENLIKRLKTTCEQIIEDYEEPIVNLFTKSKEDTICADVVNECTEAGEPAKFAEELKPDEDEEEVVAEDEQEGEKAVEVDQERDATTTEEKKDEL